jgi:hypothetical protein
VSIGIETGLRQQLEEPGGVVRRVLVAVDAWDIAVDRLVAQDVPARAANRWMTLVKSVLLDQFAERPICLEEIVVLGGTKFCSRTGVFPGTIWQLPADKTCNLL